MSKRLGRLFPAPQADIYDTASDDAAAMLLGLARIRLSFRQRYLGFRLHGSLPLTRLLAIHRQALADEMAGRSEAAALLFEEAVLIAKRLWANEEALFTCISGAAEQPLDPPAAALLGKALLREVLVDLSLHLAMGCDPEDARRDRHLGIADEFLACEERPGPDDVRLRDAIALCRYEASLRNRQFLQAATVAEAAAHRTGEGVWAARAGEAHYREFVSDWNKAGDNPAEQGQACDNVTPWLVRWRDRYPAVRDTYLFLSDVYRLHAVSSANRDMLVVAIHKARLACLHDPSAAAPQDLLQQVYAKVGSVTQMIADAEWEIENDPGSQLSYEASELKQEARRAQALLAQWSETDETIRIAQQEKEAIDHLDALASIDGAGAALAASLAADPICPPPPAGDRERGVDWLFSRRARGPRRVLVAGAAFLLLGTGAYATDRIGEASRAGSYARVVAAADARDAATVVAEGRAFLSTPVLGTDSREAYVRNLVAAAEDRLGPQLARDRAVRAIEAARQAGEPEAVLIAAEDFFGNLPAGLEDPRQASMALYYRQAFNAWLLEGAAANNPRVAAFRRLEPMLGGRSS